MPDVFIRIMISQYVGDFVLPNTAHGFVAHGGMLTLPTQQCQARFLPDRAFRKALDVGNEASLGCAGLRSPLSSKNVCFTFSQNEGWITVVIQPSLSSQPSITSLAIYTLTRVTRIKSEQRLRCSACPQTRAFLSDPKHHP